MGLKRILMALERHGKVEKLPAPYAVILAKEGFEAEAYKEYLRLTAAGKTVDLYAGGYGEGVEYAREKGAAKILAADQEGVKEV